MAWQAVQFDEAAKARIHQAATLEKRLRLESILGVPFDIGPCRLRQLTARDVLQFEYAENRLFVGGEPKWDDYAHVVDVLLHGPKISGKRLAGLIRDILRSPDAKLKLQSHLIDSFNDLPTFGGNKNGSSDTASSWVWITDIIDTLASQYGWGVDHILDMPIECAFQLSQLIHRRLLGRKYAIRHRKLSQARAAELNRTNGNG